MHWPIVLLPSSYMDHYLSDEIDYISSGKRQISSYLTYHIQDGSQQGHVRVARFPLVLLIAT